MNKVNKNNSKGFTLLELIISTSIFVVIISIGYTLLKDYNINANEQVNITNSQLSISNLNKMITKDLEQSQHITLESLEYSEKKEYATNYNEFKKDENYLADSLDSIIEEHKIVPYKDENTLSYRYITKKLDDSQSVTYTVEMKYKKGKPYIEYCIYRSLKDGANIEVTSNYKIKKDGNLFPKPISITNNNPYLVTIQGKGRNDSVSNYEFKVASRIIESSYTDLLEPPINEELPEPPKQNELPKPPGFGQDYTSIGFWTADGKRC